MPHYYRRPSSYRRTYARKSHRRSYASGARATTTRRRYVRRTTAVSRRPRRSVRTGGHYKRHVRSRSGYHRGRDGAVYTKRPSKAFMSKVNQSTGGVLHYIGERGNFHASPVHTTHATATFFQPHGISDIGSPAITPTPNTEIPYYPFCYEDVSQVLSSVFPDSFPENSVSFRQSVSMSCHYEYQIRNMINETIKLDVFRWHLKKPVPAEMIGMYGTATSPVYTGNVLNLLGNAMAAMGIQDSIKGAINAGMINADSDPSQFPLFCDYISFKKFTVHIPVGKSRTFRVGVKQNEINTADNFIFIPNGVYTLDQLWANAFIPGATGLFFKLYANQAKPSTSGFATAATNYTGMTYDRTAIVCNTKSHYTVYEGSNVAAYSKWFNIGYGGILDGDTTLPIIIDELNGARASPIVA